eukprot:210560_1
MTQSDNQLSANELYEWMDKIEKVVETSYQVIDEDDYGMNEIIDGFLYLGDWKDSKYVNISQKGITYVLNCCGMNHDYKKHSNNIKEHKIDAADAMDYQIINKHCKECIVFIDKCKEQNEKILVHCFAGVNRSVTMTVVYLMHYYDEYNLLQAIEHVVQRRSGVLYNTGFRKQLVEYAYSINKLNGYIPECIIDKNKIDIVQWEDDDNDEYEMKENKDTDEGEIMKCNDNVDTVDDKNYIFCKQIVIEIIDKIK